MEVRIGVQNVAREIAFESSQGADEVTKTVAAALKDGGYLSLSDDKGRSFIVPVSAIGYVNLGEAEKGRVGFGTT
ncbi:MAG: DUF3107 domain-containing protein [Actinomycetota bacterium]|nr:DUF3107 domain-containing protein [Actinomycetota bacterium]